MACAAACQLLLTNAKAALSNLEKAMAELQHNEKCLSQEKEELQQERANIEAARQQAQKARDDLDAEKAAMMKNGVGPNNLVGLNFRGEKTVVMKRSVLCQVEGSMLAAMFSGRYENNFDHDKDGNVYIGYPPSVMIPLMDWLTAFQDAPPDARAPNINLPDGLQDLWDGAVKFFGLESLFAKPPVAKMFSGVQKRLKMADLPGWRVALCKPANEIISMADFDLPGIALDSHLLIGAKKPGEDELFVAAIGRRDFISSHGWDRHHNNVYWSFDDDDDIFCFAARPLERWYEDIGHAFHTTFHTITIDQFANAVGSDWCVWSFSTNNAHGKKFDKLIMVPIDAGERSRRA